jgi:hypothetical protein
MALRRIVFALVALAIGGYYLWGVRATGYRFEWGQDLTGYYDYLGRAFAQGHLDLPVDPRPELLALSDPYDPQVGNDYKLWDAALFHQRYYLYHGAGPAVLLFAPWRLLTRHDLPENFALLLFCFGGWLFAAGTLMQVLRLAEVRAGPVLLAALLLALGICQAIPFLLNRVWVYEVAIGGGYFCVSAAFFLLARSIGSARKVWWLAGSGLLFGLAVSCRPTLGLAAVIAFGAILAAGIGDRDWSGVTAFAVPLACVGAGIAFYNYARFGNPLEFGVRYLLSGPFQNRIWLRAENILPGLYYNLFCRPDFDAVFPWMRAVLRYPFQSASQLPKEYFVEPTAGAWFLAPFMLWAVFPPRDAVRLFLRTLTASGVAILLFISATGFVTQRYAVDFLPLLVLPALASAGICLSRSAGWRRITLALTLTISILFGAVLNLALGLSGPYDDVLKNRPASYARLAKWFSPAAELRPLMNPRVDVEFSADLTRLPEGVPEPLLTIGRAPYSQFLYAERNSGALRIVLRTPQSEAAWQTPSAGVLRIGVKCDRASGKLTVSIDGKEGLAADPGIIFTAPSQVTLGKGVIQVVKKTVEE